MTTFNFRQWFSTPQSRFGLAALLSIVVPPILWGPWLPLPDLISFVALDTYPAEHSFGPFHYAVFQFTYILHLAASRFMSALGLTAPAQIVIFYLLQAGMLFIVLGRMIGRLIPGAWLASVLIVSGALAFWEGQFLWGGPLPCSLAATLLAVALGLSLWETENEVPHAGVIVPALAMTSLLSHPFALPFAVVLVAFRWVFVPRRRMQSVMLLFALLVMAWVIRRDSPDPDGVGGALRDELLAVNTGQIIERLRMLFVMDVTVAKYLFGDTSVWLNGYLIGLGVVHLVGFMLSPVVAVLARSAPMLRALAVLDTLVGAMYLLSPGLEKILPWWPQRILAFYSPFTFVAAVAGGWFLVTRKWPALASKATTSRRVVWLVPAALLGVIWLVQWPVFRLSEEVRRNFAQIRSEILQTNLSHAFVVESDLIDVRPAYLRSVAFLLFSDRTLVDRDLLFYTEWHGQARHPTRLTENWFELGRQQYVASFRAEADGLHVRLKAQPAGEVAIATRNNAFENSQMALWAKGRGDTLYLSGHYRDALAQYRSAARLAPGLWEIHNNFASTCAQLGLNGEAIAGYEAALQIKSDLPEAHSSLGYLLLATGRKAEAATHFEATLRLKPDHVAARQGLAQSAAAR